MMLLAGGAGGPSGGQQAYTTAGTYSWVAPAGVTSVSVVAVGPGGSPRSYSGQVLGCGGGGLGYKNNIAVTPGNSYTVVVGSVRAGPTWWNGTPSYFINTSTVAGYGGYGYSGNNLDGTYVGDGGGYGGFRNDVTPYSSSGGGGAGGYSGNGGNGGQGNNPGDAGSGGGGGGGSGGYTYPTNCCGCYITPPGGTGGGVGILGQGSSGAGGTSGGNGGAGSGGSGQTYGGGGRPQGRYSCGSPTGGAINGGPGAVRIIWGEGRAFPSTNTGNV
jgi:hypothetical protein